MLSWMKRMVIERRSLLALAVVLLALAFIPMARNWPANSSEWASWVQGIGTVAAMLGSAWVAKDAYDRDRRREVQRQEEGRRLDLEVIRQALTELVAMVTECLGVGNSLFEYYRHRGLLDAPGGFDVQAFAALVNLIQDVPLAALHGPALHIQLHKAQVFANRAEEATAELRNTVAGNVVAQPVAALDEMLMGCYVGLTAARDAFAAEIERLH